MSAKKRTGGSRSQQRLKARPQPRQGSKSNQRRPPPRRPRGTTPPRFTAGDVSWTIVGVAGAVVVVLLLRLGGALHAGGSVIFWLVALAGAVAVVDAIRGVAARDDGLLTARRAALVICLAVTPVVFNPETNDVFNVTKFTFVTGAALLVAGLWAVSAARQGRLDGWRSGLQWPLLALVGWTVVCTLTSTDVRSSLTGLYGSNSGLIAVLAFAVLFAATAASFRGEHVRRVLSAFYFAGGGLVVVYGFLQLYDRTVGHQHWDWVSWGSASFKGSSIWSTLGNPNHMAGFLAMLLPIGVGLFVTTRRWLERVGIIAITGLLVAEMLQTAARGALVAAIVALVVFGLAVIPDIRRHPRAAGALVAALVVVVVGTGLAFTANDTLSPKLKTALTSEDTAVLRVELWHSAWKIGTAHPVVGTGPDTFELVFPRFQTRKFVDLYGAREIANGSHNIFLTQLAATGFPGLVLFTALLALAALRAASAWRRFRVAERRDGGGDAPPGARRDRYVLSALAAAGVAYLVQASFNVQQIGLDACFWLLLGLLTVMTVHAGVPDSLSPRRLFAVAGDDAESEPSPRPAARPGTGRGRARRSTTPVVVAAVVATVAVLLGWWWIGQQYRADHRYWLALGREGSLAQTVQQNPSGALEAIDAVRGDYRAAARLDPWETLYRRRAADFEVRTSTAQGIAGTSLQRDLLDQARTLYLQALRRQPDSALLQGGFASVIAQMEQAGIKSTSLHLEQRRALERAVENNPWDERYRIALADVLIPDGRLSQARRAIDEGIVRRGRQPELVRRLARILDKEGNPTAALVRWREILAVNPGDTEAVTAVHNASGG